MENQKWYRVTVLIPEERPKGTFWSKKIFKTDSVLHYLLTGEVFSECIEKNIELWRFSRYHYKDDDIIMKFKFYSEEYIFNRIKEKVRNNKIIKELKKEKLIRITVEEATESDDRIGSDRDTNWNYELSESWPYFINGLSKMWLNLILLKKERYLKENYLKIDNKIRLYNLIDIYSEIKELVVKDWIDWGSHTIYHHANALFGYYHVRFNVNIYSLYYKKERRVNKSESAWTKRIKGYNKYLDRLIFIKKIFRWIKFKNRIGYIDL